MQTLAPSFLSVALAASASSTTVLKAGATLEDECGRVSHVYPLLMLAVMAEGPMNCGNPEFDEFVDCHAGESPREARARARRLEIRTVQRNAYKKARDACEAFADDPASGTLRDAAQHAVSEARLTDEVGTRPQ